MRHTHNVLNEKEKFEKKVKDNKEKLMKKYVTFYWSRRNREEEKKEKFLHFNEKYEEKNNRLELIERNIEKKRKNLIKKIQTIEANQNQLKERDKEKYESLKEKRTQYINSCRLNKKKLMKLLDEDKEDILEYQAIVLTRKEDMDKKIQLQKDNFTEKTIYNQLTFEKNLKPFYK